MKKSARTVRRSSYYVLGPALVLLTLLSACGGGSEPESTNDLSSAELGQTSGGVTDFSYTGADQSFTVPEGVTELVLDLWGAGGEMASADLGGLDCEDMPGGGGGYVNARVLVTPGEVLTVRVGGAPANRTGAGWPDGGTGWLDQVRMGRRVYTFGVYGGGGGSSSIRRGDTVLVEAGGGNGGFPCTDPVGGGVAGTCSPSGNQPGTSHASTGGGAGGGGWCGGGADAPSASGVSSALQWSLEAASGQTPGGSTHPARQGSGEGGFTSPATHGRIHVTPQWTPPPTESAYGVFEPLPGNTTTVGDPRLLAQRVTIPTATTVLRLGTVTNHNPVPFRMALYADAGGVPGAIIAETPFVSNVVGRNEVPLGGATGLALNAGSYWIAIQFLGDGGYVRWFSSPAIPRTSQCSVSVTEPLPSTFTPCFPVSDVNGAINVYVIGTP